MDENLCKALYGEQKYPFLDTIIDGKVFWGTMDENTFLLINKIAPLNLYYGLISFWNNQWRLNINKPIN